jgi:uncharacterized protein (DUF1800 family)
MLIEAVIAANRFGLGARPAELKRIGSDAREWLAGQVKGPRPLPGAITGLPSSASVFGAYAQGRREQRNAREASASTSASTPPPQAALARVRDTVLPMYLGQVTARYEVAMRTEEPFRERLVHFWTNHFAVSADKAQVLALAGTLENEAVRPNLSGRFVDLLLAVESHPAMILYLDNQASIGPNSQLGAAAARRAATTGRKRDINENLAREILELHTLGVDGGYTQTDVTTFAKALTGWSVGGPAFGRGGSGGDPGKFVFHDAAHEPGSKVLLRKTYSQDGIAQPRAILTDLARHPSTATHIATKLVRHFVADEPPGPAVERIAKVFRDSDGDLPRVHRALIDLPQAWEQPLTKFKTPHDFVISAFRMLDLTPPQGQQMLGAFQSLGQRPYTPGSPAGWPDKADQWDGPDALLKRIEWATTLGERVGSRVNAAEAGAAALGEVMSERTRVAIARAASAAQAVTLLLASPEFQRR